MLLMLIWVKKIWSMSSTAQPASATVSRTMRVQVVGLISLGNFFTNRSLWSPRGQHLGA